MNIQRTALLAALDKVLPATGDAKTMEGADSVYFADGWAHTYRDDMSISAPVPDLVGLTAAVKSKDIAKVVKKLRGDVIEVTKSETSLAFVCGTTEGEINLQPDALSHALASLGLDALEWKECPTGMRTAIALARLENHREQYPVVHFSDNEALSLANSRWNIGKFHGDPVPAFSIHTEGAKVLLTMGELSQYAVGDLWAHWQTESGAVFSAKVHPDPFPLNKVNAVLNLLNSKDPIFSCPMPRDLGEKVSTVAVFASEDQTQGTPMVEIEVKGKEIRLSTSNSGGKAKDRCILEAPLPEGVEARFLASVPYLEEAAKRVHTMAVAVLPYKDKNGNEAPGHRLLFRGDDFLQVVVVSGS